MEVEFLGGAREVGRSALLVDDALLLDYGLLTADPPQYPVRDPGPDAVVVSHGHLDHAGAVPALLKGDRRPAIHWTPPTADLTRTLARDTLKLHGNSPLCPFSEEHVARLGEVETRHGYAEPFVVAAGGTDYEVTLFNAGHIPGSAHVLVDDGRTRLLYTGDFHTDDQRLVSGTTARPDADAVICESTYADVTHEERRAVEDRWAESVKATIWEGGTVVAPAFAIGRTQELMLVAEANDLTPYVDGMGTEVTRLVRQYPEFLRDAEALRRAKGAARFVTGRDGQRERIAADNELIITTSGMLAGGPVHSYLPNPREPDEPRDADGVSGRWDAGPRTAGARAAGDKRSSASRQRPRGVVRLLRARRPRRAGVVPGLVPRRAGPREPRRPLCGVRRGPPGGRVRGERAGTGGADRVVRRLANGGRAGR